MYTDKLRLFHLILIILIASQGIFYLLGAAEAFRKLSIGSFVEQRKLLDTVIAGRLRIIYPAALTTGLLILFFVRNAPENKVFICTAVATILIFTDTMLAIKYSIQLNNMFLKFSESGSTDWRLLQINWTSCMVARGICSAFALTVTLFSFYK